MTFGRKKKKSNDPGDADLLKMPDWKTSYDVAYAGSRSAGKSLTAKTLQDAYNQLNQDMLRQQYQAQMAQQQQQSNLQNSLRQQGLGNSSVMPSTNQDYKYILQQLQGYGAGSPASRPMAPARAAKAAPKPKPEKPTVSFDTVILEDWKKEAILDTIAGRDNHQLIFEKWGFDEVMEKGKATSFLFWGPPGTGKTLMAQAIADKLGEKLLVIGSGEIESSEPGGAERAIKQFFQTKDKVLLFDECDSLVYERASVGSILGAQVNALLTCLENYEGTVIFTTNRLGVLDEALNRRISLKIEFAMPSLAERVKIWQRMFPKKAPLAKNINWERLASIEVTGGYIKNAVLRAARIAANKKMKTITEKVIVEALRREIESMIEFENAKANSPRIPQMMGPSIGRGSDLTKTIGRDKTKGM